MNTGHRLFPTLKVLENMTLNLQVLNSTMSLGLSCGIQEHTSLLQVSVIQ